MIFPTDLKHNLYKRRKFIRIQISFSDLNMLYFNVKTLNSCKTLIYVTHYVILTTFNYQNCFCLHVCNIDKKKRKIQKK